MTILVIHIILFIYFSQSIFKTFCYLSTCNKQKGGIRRYRSTTISNLKNSKWIFYQRKKGSKQKKKDV